MLCTVFVGCSSNQNRICGSMCMAQVRTEQEAYSSVVWNAWLGLELHGDLWEVILPLMRDIGIGLEVNQISGWVAAILATKELTLWLVWLCAVSGLNCGGQHLSWKKVWAVQDFWNPDESTLMQMQHWYSHLSSVMYAYLWCQQSFAPQLDHTYENMVMSENLANATE